MEPQLEKRLIERAQRGEMAAFEQLYRAYAPALLHRVIRPRVPNPSDAEDVLVDTFTTALEHLPRFSWRERGFFAWLARISANKCYDSGRRLGRRQRGQEMLEAADEERPPVEQPDEVLLSNVDRALAQERVDETLAALNPRYARALRLRLLEGRSRQECADEMEVRLGTFDVVVLRAVRAFRKEWAARYDEEEG